MNIGKTIADYRKAANMTQSEVADQLGVTYQAVSKWERDESLPDITMLPKIADLFHISIDTLLRGSFEMKEEKEVATARHIIEEVTEAEQDETTITIEPTEKQAQDEAPKAADIPVDDEMTKSDEHPDDAFININLGGLLEQLAPLMKPNQLDRVVGKLGRMNKKLSSIYPFLKRERMSELIAKTPLDELEIDELLPFLNSAQRDLLIEKIVQYENVPDFLDLDDLYPFLNSAQKTILLSWLLAYDRFDLLDDFMPFSNSEHREKIIDEMLETGNLEYVSETYPFINNELKDRLLTYFIENRMTEELSELMDFM